MDQETNNTPVVGTQTPDTQTVNEQVNTSPKKKVGPIVAILVTVLILIVIGLIMLSSNISSDVDLNSDTTTGVTAEVPVITNQSDEPEDLISDLESALQGLDENNF